MPDLRTGAGMPRRLRTVWHRRGLALALPLAVAAGLATVVVVGLEGGRVERAAPAPPLPPPPSSATAVRDVPADLWFGMAGPPAEAFSRPERPGAALPDLNADARAILADLDGRWTDGETRLDIDARRHLARVGRGAPQPLVVRDIGTAMIVADIGPQRFVLLRRPGGVALAGATLPAPVELRRE